VTRPADLPIWPT